MIVGTAGHVDHGKTTLVRALTGVDTDRLPEEKARGISIALGYAYAPLPDGEVLGFVDVPGHEKFLATMLAGATGIDFALLVVAADDGIMPQTREHLDILCLLGVRAGAVALTKVDAVDPARAARVAGDIAALTAATPLAASPVFEVCAPSGHGVEPLRAYLQAQAQSQALRWVDADAHFRLAVDRSFTLAGIGTIVTGTVHSGQVSLGDSVALAPGGGGARVRGIHAQDRASPTGTAGQRCALNLAGVARDAVRRGDWIVAPAALLSTQRFDGRFTLLAGQEHALRSGSAVHLHVGAAHVPGRIVVIDAGQDASPGERVEPGQSRLVQLVLQHPVALWHGDRFIVRDAAATKTLGGGTVLDPLAPSRYRRTAERRAVLGALRAESPALRLHALIAQAPLGIDLQRFALAANSKDPEALLRDCPARRVAQGGGDFAVGIAHWRALRESALAALHRFHQAHADEAGPDRARFKRIAFPRLAAPIYAALVAELCADGSMMASGPWLHLPGHTNTPSAAELALLQRLLPRLAQSPVDPPWVRDLARELGAVEGAVRAALLRGAQRGEVHQVVRDLFYHASAVQELERHVRRLQAADGEVRATTFRDAIGLGRKRAIQILEYFDRIGLLRRVGDRHLVRPDALLKMGEAAPEASPEGSIKVSARSADAPAGGARAESQIRLEAGLPDFLPQPAARSKPGTPFM
jgi:selenocysteine-specific elongation factor